MPVWGGGAILLLLVAVLIIGVEVAGQRRRIDLNDEQSAGLGA